MNFSWGLPFYGWRRLWPRPAADRFAAAIERESERQVDTVEFSAFSGDGGCRITRSGQTLFLHGELDLGTRHLLDRAGEDFISYCTAEHTGTRSEPISGPTPPAVKTVVVDAAGLQFIDAAGLGTLVMLHIHAARAGIPIRTIHAPVQLRRMSSICELDAVLGLEAAGVIAAGGPGFGGSAVSGGRHRADAEMRSAGGPHAEPATPPPADDERAGQLTAALLDNQQFGRAIGIVMSLYEVSEDEAFDLLQSAGRHSSRPLPDVALEVIETGRLDPTLHADHSAADPGHLDPMRDASFGGGLDH